MNSGMETAQRSPCGPRRVAVFAALCAVYYAAYFVVFAIRVGDYWRDILRHFPFARRLFG